MRCLIVALVAFGALTSGARAQLGGGEPVTFDSRDARGAAVPLRGVLYRPEGTAKGSVVLVHGSGGWRDYREGLYGRALRTAGFVVLAIDCFGPRGIASTEEDQTRLATIQMTRDALAARRFLVSQGVDPARMAVMGFSKGGAVALYASDRTMLPVSEPDRFPLAIPYYPACVNRPREPKPASVVFMILAEKDDYTGVKPCQELAADYVRAGGSMTIKVYPGATHAFDGDPASTRMFHARWAENYSDCVVYIEPGGTQTYDGRNFGNNDAALSAELKRTCMKKGATMWTNPGQKEAALQDVIDFLNRSLTN